MLSIDRRKLLCNLNNWYKNEKDKKMFNQQNLIDWVELNIII